MLVNKIFLILFLIYQVHCGSDQVLFNTGWYKTRKRSEKKNIFKVDSINPTSVPSTASYLKINAVIPVLYQGAIRDLDQLQDLAMASCGIRDIQPGAFQNLSQISRMNLKENGIERIRNGVFNKLPLTVLFLNKNEIKTIDSEAFNDMPQLRKIKLNSNQISVWDSSWFKNTPLLITVSVRRNFIKEIPARAFQNFARSTTPTDESKPPGPKIFLSKNEISVIHPQAFAGLERIGQILLDRNRLRKLNSNIFYDPIQIHVLSMARNNITEIPQDFLKNVKDVRVFDISANRKIKCVPVEVVEVVKELKMINNSKMNCTCVKKLQKKAEELKHILIFDTFC